MSAARLYLKKMIKSNIWEAGDFAKIAPRAQIVGEILCEAIPVYAGDRVIDIGCGTGNTAFAAARRMAQVSAVDPVPDLLQKAKERASFEGLEIDFREGGAESIAFDDASFDVALSTFGMIFSEDPAASVREAARVLRPGGRLGLTSWSTSSLNFRLFEICAKARPGLRSIEVACQWGAESQALAWLAKSFGSIRIEKRNFYPRALSTEQWLAGMKQFLAPVFLAYDGASVELRSELDSQLLALGHEYNIAPEHGFYARIEYLEIHCRKA